MLVVGGLLLLVLLLLSQSLLAQLLLTLVNVAVQLVSVLSDRELLVVVDRDVDLPLANWLVLWVVELGHVLVLQGLLGAQTLVGVKLQEMAQQIQRFVRSSWEHVTKSLLLYGRQGLKHSLRERRVDSFDVLSRGSASDFHDAIKLVEGACAREAGLAQQELSKDAAQTPHIYALGIFVAAQQNLRSAVPARRNVISQERLLIGLLVKRTGQAKVRALHVALSIEQQVTGLQVAVEKIRRVHVLEALKYLIDDVLLVDILQNVGADHSMQVRVHEVEDQVDVAIVFSAYHILQPDNVLVA